MRPVWRPLLAITAGLLVTILVAAGVTLAILRLESRTNPQQVNLQPGVTLTQDSAIVQAAAKGRPAVVSVVTQHQPAIVRGSGYLATSDGYIVTSINVIAGANGLTVLVPGDPATHAARLVDYDCQTGVAVIKIDTVSGLPTLVFADGTQILSAGQLVVASVGATTADVTPESAALGGGAQGAQVVVVEKGGPAALAGLQSGDVITQLDDVRIDAAHPLSLLLRSRFHANQRVTVTYTRGKSSTQAELTLTGQHPTC